MNLAPRFECELPPPVRKELIDPKRLKILKFQKALKSWCMLYIAISVTVLAVWLMGFYHPETDPKGREIILRAIAAVGVSPTPIAITHSMPAIQTFSDYSGWAPKAELIKLPPWRIGETRAMQMRYGEIVNATLRGQVDSYNQLPRRGQLGDMWIVAGTPWIWTHPSGSAFTTWIDP
jgi:hypothetical protein